MSRSVPEVVRRPQSEPSVPGGSRQGEVFVVNRDPEMRLFLDKAFFVGDLPCVRVATPQEALACAGESRYAVVLVSIESADSVDLVEWFVDGDPEVQVVAISSVATPELVRDVYRAGAVEFFFGRLSSKTVIARLRELVRSATCVDPECGAVSHEPEVAAASSSEGAPTNTTIISKNSATERVLATARKVAKSDSTVLIHGESGTGKELLARYIHENSPRADSCFIEVNCGALPENLLESQLFGHEKGSFTGASQRQLGLFEIANGGTILLDEIAEMSLDMQVKILRVLQSREFRRLGGSPVIKVDVRVIAATNRNLKVALEKGRFRSDLYYRLNVIDLELPPLRKRREEIPLLVEHFCHECATSKKLGCKSFTDEAILALQKLRWEGNIRELENSVERLILLSQGDKVGAEDVAEHLAMSAADLEIDSDFALTLTLDEVKKLHVARVLRQNEGNKMKTARMLKINVKTLYNLIKNLGVEL